MRRGAGVLVLVLGLVLAGCGGGGQSSAAKQRMNDRFDALETKITTQYETAATPYNNYLEKAARQYVALVHEYRNQLGPKEAKQRLMAMGNQIADFCTACAGDLYDAAAGY
jgi:ABC-type glycerol-3-phosphate transport system substrate-binding protein